MVWRVEPGSGDGPRPAASQGGGPRLCWAATSARRRLEGGCGAGTGELPGPSHSPLREEDWKKGGFYSVLKSYPLPTTRCANLAWYLNLCNQSALARQSLGLGALHASAVHRGHRPLGHPLLRWPLPLCFPFGLTPCHPSISFLEFGPLELRSRLP